MHIYAESDNVSQSVQYAIPPRAADMHGEKKSEKATERERENRLIRTRGNEASLHDKDTVHCHRRESAVPSPHVGRRRAAVMIVEIALFPDGKDRDIKASRRQEGA